MIPPGATDTTAAEAVEIVVPPKYAPCAANLDRRGGDCLLLRQRTEFHVVVKVMAAVAAAAGVVPSRAKSSTTTGTTSEQ